jgi:hypothetical protein
VGGDQQVSLSRAAPTEFAGAAIVAALIETPCANERQPGLRRATKELIRQSQEFRRKQRVLAAAVHIRFATGPRTPETRIASALRAQ